MQHCKQQLLELADTAPTWQQAVNNLLSDLQTTAQPHGNIPENMAKALERGCKTAGADVPATIQAHQTVRRTDLRSPTQRPTQALRLCFSRTTFAVFHLASGADSANNAHAWTDVVTPLQLQDLKGTTGRVDSPTWWTFADHDLPPDADTYMAQLAMPRRELDLARLDGMAVVLDVPIAAFRQDFYKPCAADAFHENTLFRPDHTPAPHGLTHPTRDKLPPLPEVIARSVPYEKLGDTAILATLTLLPFQAARP